MDIYHDLLAIGLLLAFAKLLEGVFKRFGLNAIIAYATAGVILGPVSGVVETSNSTQLLLSLGIFVFFFLIGLDELDIGGFLRAIRGKLVVAAVLSLSVSMLAALAVTSDVIFDLQLGLGFTQALALAGVLSLSSLGVVAKVLMDEGRLREPVGIQIFTAVVIAEVLALFVVGFGISDHLFGGAHEFDWLNVVIIIGEIIGFTIVTWFVCNKIMPWVLVQLHRFIHVPQLSYGMSLGTLFLVVVGAETVGLHGSIGALLFGAALSSLPYQVRHDLMPGMKSTAEGLFVPLFFASAGLNLSLDFLDLPIGTILALTLVPLAGKFVGAFLGAFVTRMEEPLAIAAGLMAKGVAEIALLLVLLGTGAIGTGVFSLLVLAMFGYILLTPFGITWAIRRVKPVEEAADRERLPLALDRFVLEGVKVKDILDGSRQHPEPSITVRLFVETWISSEQHDYVVVEGTQLQGIVSLGMLRYLPRSQWSTTRIGEILRHVTPEASPEDLVEDVLQRMIDSGLTALPVVDPETQRFMGSITSYEALAMIVESATGRGFSPA